MSKRTTIQRTTKFQVDIIELRKALKEYETNTSDEVLQWMKFLNDPEDKEINKIMKENKDIKEAKDQLDLISRDDTLRWLALRTEITRMDNEQCLEDAENRGIRKGKKEGKIEEKIEIAKNMLKEKIDIKVIEKVTGLTEEEIKKL